MAEEFIECDGFGGVAIDDERSLLWITGTREDDEISVSFPALDISEILLVLSAAQVRYREKVHGIPAVTQVAKSMDLRPLCLLDESALCLELVLANGARLSLSLPDDRALALSDGIVKMLETR